MRQLISDAQIYCISAKTALKSVGLDTIAEDALTMRSNEVMKFTDRKLLHKLSTWIEDSLTRNGGNVRDKNDVAWHIGVYTQMYIIAKKPIIVDFDKLFIDIYDYFYGDYQRR